LRILNEACDPEVATDKSLPNNAFLVSYSVGEEKKYDLVISSKKVEIFDHYYDKYKKDLIDIQQSDGTANPKLWKSQEEMQKSSKKK
jgi:hypothetical protein